MEISFPIEFLVSGTPVSLQTKRPAAKQQWMERVRLACSPAIPSPHFASSSRIAVSLFYFPAETMEGDIDNIVKPILDALSRHIYVDDCQVERVLIQKFEPGNIFDFRNPSATFLDAISGDKPKLYVRVSDNPAEELK